MTQDNRISQQEYESSFRGKMQSALQHALDIRKFEIELYWKRAAYFWTFIGATFAAYGAIQASAATPEAKNDLSVIASCLGFVFSLGWFFANRGSKQWQENWENHVDLLENEIIGPLYKTVLRRPNWKETKEMREKGEKEPITMNERLKFLRAKITGPGRFSVSKINQIISLFVTLLWLILLWKSLRSYPKSTSTHWQIILLTVAAFPAFYFLGRTSKGDYSNVATRRESKIVPDRKVTQPIEHRGQQETNSNDAPVPNTGGQGPSPSR
jgi:hypothetical protein